MINKENTIEHRFSILPNHYYILKLSAESETNYIQNTFVNVHIFFCGSDREMNIELPVLGSNNVEQTSPQNYLERYLIFRAALTESSVLLYTDQASIEIKAVIQAWNLELVSSEQYDQLQKLIKDFSATTIQVGERTWPVLLGLESLELLPGLTPLQETSAQINVLASPIPPIHSNIYVACWGDDLFVDTVSQSFNVESLNTENLYLLDDNLFNAILIQKRSTKLQEKNSNIILNAIRLSGIPIFIVEDKLNGNICIKKYNKHPIEIYGHEYDMLNIIPSNRIEHLNSIAVHGASDLYQFESFQSVIEQFVDFGYNVTIFESTYSHHPRVTWERFNNSSVTVFNKISLTEQVAAFRHCAFVLVCGYSLRNSADWLTVAYAALMSGSIPIVIGETSDSHKIFDRFFSFEACYSYMHAMDSILFSKVWLSKFRQFMNLQNKKSASIELYSHILGKNFFNYRMPSAEIICVTKRPNNISLIAQNIYRQTYKNLAVHIIWNVSPNKFSFCKELSKQIHFPNIRVSCINEQYNIGYCLNYGITHSEANTWFKMDDDDFYGTHYIEDMMSYYSIGNFDAIFKPSFFIKFKDNPLYGRQATERRSLCTVKKNTFGCGATLSANTSKLGIPFSNTHRNSNDSEWQKELWKQNAKIFIGDIFNYCTLRSDGSVHTWQVPAEKIKKKSKHIGIFSEEWLNAN